MVSVSAIASIHGGVVPYLVTVCRSHYGEIMSVDVLFTPPKTNRYLDHCRNCRRGFETTKKRMFSFDVPVQGTGTKQGDVHLAYLSLQSAPHVCPYCVSLVFAKQTEAYRDHTLPPTLRMRFFRRIRDAVSRFCN